MTEQELVKMMYEKHNKMLLNMEEAAIEWGSSYSAVSKMFPKNNPLAEKNLLEKKIIPPWIKYKSRRKWKITDIGMTPIY